MSLVIRGHEPLAPHTVFQIGGPARFFAEVASPEDLAEAMTLAVEQKLPWRVLGAGSNVLVADRGFDGVVIHPVGGTVRRERNTLIADAAVPLARVVRESLGHGLRGFEWAIGIPGTVGGSVYGNAGCFGREMKDVVESVTVFSAAKGTTEQLSRATCGFAYRSSIFKRRPELVVLDATLWLAPGDPTEGQALLRALTARRIETQDIGSASAGCAFQNIPWDRRDVSRVRPDLRFPELAAFRDEPTIPAGFLIDQAGLKGRCIGNACVSDRHANYIVNRGGATAAEVIMLIGLIKEYVHRKYGLALEEELQYIGFGR